LPIRMPAFDSCLIAEASRYPRDPIRPAHTKKDAVISLARRIGRAISRSLALPSSNVTKTAEGHLALSARNLSNARANGRSSHLNCLSARSGVSGGSPTPWNVRKISLARGSGARLPSVGILAAHDSDCGPQDDADVEPDAPVLDIQHVQLDPPSHEVDS